MMLDTKSEEKQPLTVRNIRKNEQSRVISFLFQIIDQHGNSLQRHQMDGVENVEKVFQIGFAPSAVVTEQEGQRHQGKELKQAGTG